jgi:hypothetical protein
MLCLLLLFLCVCCFVFWVFVQQFGGLLEYTIFIDTSLNTHQCHPPWFLCSCSSFRVHCNGHVNQKHSRTKWSPSCGIKSRRWPECFLWPLYWRIPGTYTSSNLPVSNSKNLQWNWNQINKEEIEFSVSWMLDLLWSECVKSRLAIERNIVICFSCVFILTRERI